MDPDIVAAVDDIVTFLDLVSVNRGTEKTILDIIKETINFDTVTDKDSISNPPT